MSDKPVRHAEADEIARAIIEAVGPKIVLAIPLGLGKPNHIVNALVQRAIREPALDLTIFTALTLETPPVSSPLERRFLEPAMDRLFGCYPPLDYARALRHGTLPPNIRIDEFFFLAGRWRNVARAQQAYISANYTDAQHYIRDRGVNVVAQLVAGRAPGPQDTYSLSCNPDITPDLLAARRAGEESFLFVGQVNSQLPFMTGESALVDAAEFNHLLDSPETDFELYSAPKRPISLADQAIGLQAARLVADGGTLQIGIGAVGDAVAQGLILRHEKNAEFRQLVSGLHAGDDPAGGVEEAPFRAGLYGASEMLTDGFVQLERAGILKREVDGAVAHAAFFVECRDFYTALRTMPEERRARFVMKPVSFTNSIYGDVEGRRRDRIKARFINSAMMVTLLGAVVSDATEDGQVVSGVGGQFDFAEQAFALDGARFVITLSATRSSRGRTVSNVVWNYGHTTIPRHRRDIIVTEYGLADLRGKSDSDVIAALLNIADSRFQPDLLKKAQAAGKLAQDYQIPAVHRNNTPERIHAALDRARRSGLLSPYPFGTDFTPVEQRLMPALEAMKQASASPLALVPLLWRGLLISLRGVRDDEALARMDLAAPRSWSERVWRWLLCGALAPERRD